MTISAGALRAAGWTLLLYGTLGIVLLVAALAIGTGPLTTADGLLSSLDGTLEAASDTAHSSSTALDSVDAGIEAARAGTTDAGTLVGDASATSDRLADAMSLTILGTQPLAALAGDFRSIADQLSQLGESLRGVGTALETSTADLGAVHDDVERLAAEVDGIRGSAAGVGASGASLRLAYVALLAWLALPALGALAVGLALLRLARSTGRAARVRVSPPGA